MNYKGKENFKREAKRLLNSERRRSQFRVISRVGDPDPVSSCFHKEHAWHHSTPQFLLLPRIHFRNVNSRKIKKQNRMLYRPYDKEECHQTYRKCCDRGLKITNKQSKKASGKVLLRNHQREGTEYGWRTIMIIGHSILLHWI